MLQGNLNKLKTVVTKKLDKMVKVGVRNNTGNTSRRRTEDEINSTRDNIGHH